MEVQSSGSYRRTSSKIRFSAPSTASGCDELSEPTVLMDQPNDKVWTREPVQSSKIPKISASLKCGCEQGASH
jgi:hypothetical protein